MVRTLPPTPIPPATTRAPVDELEVSVLLLSTRLPAANVPGVPVT